MLQILLCLLLMACRPANESPNSRNGEATLHSSNVHEMTGAGGTRHPIKPRKKTEPSEPRDRPVNKSRCLDSAVAGGVVWTTFCRDIQDASIRKRCFEVGLESEQRRKGFCNNFF